MRHIFRLNHTRLLSFSILLGLFFSISLNLFFTIQHASAINPIMYALNNILGYDGEEECDYTLWGDNFTSSGDSSSVVGGNTGEKLRNFVKEYGELAQELQVQYGVPWELVFGQAVAESSVGTSTNPTAVDKMAADRGHYNWLGLKYSDNHKYNIKIPEGQRIHNGYGDWNEYESLENMIKGFYIDFLRNGNYDPVFKYSTADNFNLDKFILGAAGNPDDPTNDGLAWRYVCGPNATASECNKAGLTAYYYNTMSGIKTAHEVAAEMGWPTSEELAKSENLGVGGKHSDLNTTINSGDSAYAGDIDTINSSDPCKQRASSFNKTNTDSVAKMAINLAWPNEDGTCETKDGKTVDYKTNGKDCYGNPKPAYAEAMTKYSIQGDAKDCGHFVAAVIYSAGVDDNFPKSGTASMLSYLQKATDTWEEIENTGNESILRPGDVLVVHEGGSHHIQIYTGSLSDYGNIASASQGTQVGIMKNLESGIKHYQGNKYHIFRLKQSSSSTGLKSEGMTKAEAEAIMSEYLTLPSSEWDKYYIPAGKKCTDGRLYNCVAFSKYFINKYTSNPQSHVGNGAEVVSSLIAAGFEDGGTTPKPYAIFSTNKGSLSCDGKPCGHTGVVFGIDADRGKIIIGEAGCGSGKAFTAIKEKNLSEYTNGSYTYAYTDKYLKGLN